MQSDRVSLAQSLLKDGHFDFICYIRRVRIDCSISHLSTPPSQSVVMGCSKNDSD